MRLQAAETPQLPPPAAAAAAAAATVVSANDSDMCSLDALRCLGALRRLDAPRRLDALRRLADPRRALLLRRIDALRRLALDVLRRLGARRRLDVLRRIDARRHALRRRMYFPVLRLTALHSSHDRDCNVRQLAVTTTQDSHPRCRHQLRSERKMRGLPAAGLKGGVTLFVFCELNVAEAFLLCFSCGRIDEFVDKALYRFLSFRERIGSCMYCGL